MADVPEGAAESAALVARFRLWNMHGPTVFVGGYREMCALARHMRRSGPYRVKVNAE